MACFTSPCTQKVILEQLGVPEKSAAAMMTAVAQRGKAISSGKTTFSRAPFTTCAPLVKYFFSANGSPLLSSDGFSSQLASPCTREVVFVAWGTLTALTAAHLETEDDAIKVQRT